MEEFLFESGYCWMIPVALFIGYFIYRLYEANEADKHDSEKKIREFWDGNGKSRGKEKKKYQGGDNYPGNWDEIRQQVLSRDGNQCGNCGSSRNLHVHHIIPLSKGGTNRQSNLRTLCQDCHKRLHPHMK